MQVMKRTNLVIVCETEEDMRYYTDGLANKLEELRDSGPPITGGTFIEDEYLIADEATIEEDKAAYELVKEEPISIPVSSTIGAKTDLSRVKIADEEPIK